MEDNEQFGSGVTDVFDAIASGHDDQRPKPDVVTVKHVKAGAAPVIRKAKTKTSAQPLAQRPTARTGRFPGSKKGPLKEKLSARVLPELKDAYVNWSLDDRCSLQDLLERALTEFYQRYRATAESSVANGRQHNE